MATRLTGWEAIEFAAKSGLLLSKHADPSGPARGDLSPKEARTIAQKNPDVIYLDFDEPDDGDFRIA